MPKLHVICPKCGYEMRVIAIITGHGKCKHSLEVNKILECLKRNNVPPFDKVEIKVSSPLFSYISMKKEISKDEVCPSIFSAMPWKLQVFFILDRMFYYG
jgi:hypothetical protein